MRISLHFTQVNLSLPIAILCFTEQHRLSRGPFAHSFAVAHHTYGLITGNKRRFYPEYMCIFFR